MKRVASIAAVVIVGIGVALLVLPGDEGSGHPIEEAGDSVRGGLPQRGEALTSTTDEEADRRETRRNLPKVGRRYAAESSEQKRLIAAILDWSGDRTAGAEAIRLTDAEWAEARRILVETSKAVEKLGNEFSTLSHNTLKAAVAENSPLVEVQSTSAPRPTPEHERQHVIVTTFSRTKRWVMRINEGNNLELDDAGRKLQDARRVRVMALRDFLADKKRR